MIKWWFKWRKGKFFLIKHLFRLDVFKVNSNKNNLNSFSPKHLNNTKKIKEDFKYSPKIFRVQSYDHKEKKVFIRRNSSKKTTQTIRTSSTLDSNSNLFNFQKKHSLFKITINEYEDNKKKILMKLKYNLL